MLVNLVSLVTVSHLTSVFSPAESIMEDRQYVISGVVITES